MRTPPENKMVSTDTCPTCGRAKSASGCRDVPAGHYCLQRGLQISASAIIAPSQDPRQVAAEQDVEVQARAREEQEAEARYQSAEKQWLAAVEDQAAAVLLAGHSERYIDSDDLEARRHRVMGLEAKRVDVENRWADRERASDELLRARVAYQDALNRSLVRHGLSVASGWDMARLRTSH
jgi:hypothetical protein